MRSFAIGLILCAACGGSGKSSTTPKVAAATCTSVADAMVEMMLEGKDPRPPQESIDELSGLIRTRCTADQWTAEAQQCLATMKSREDAERCSAMLTEAQQANLVRDQQATYGARDGEGGGEKAEPATEGSDLDDGTGTSKNKKQTRRQGDPCDGGE